METTLFKEMERLQFFFKDFDGGYSSDNAIIMRIVTSLDAEMFGHGDVVIPMHKLSDKIYFVREQSVTVLDSRRKMRLVDLPVGSWFGEYQVLFNQTGTFDYVAACEPGGPATVFLMTLPAEVLVEVCDENPRFDKFVRLRAMRRRAYLRMLETEI